MIIVGWLFSYYKSFYRKILKLIFIIIKNIVIFICAKDIEEILKTDKWKNARSILFFYTNILIDVGQKNEKNYPVRKFQVKWYIWLIHYIWAVWVIFKIIIYLTIFYFFKYLKFGLWRDLWKILLEYWRLRLGIINWILHLTWIFIMAIVICYRIGMFTYKDKYHWIGDFYKFIRMTKYVIKLRQQISKYYSVIDKWLR